MSVDMNVGEVRKGGITWFELTVGRHFHGLEVHAKVVPQVEEFVKALGDGSTEYSDMFDRAWFPLKGDDRLKVYVVKDLIASNYTIGRPGSEFKYPKDMRINLSFLRLVGIGSPSGVRFGVEGPYSPAYSKALFGEVMAATRTFIMDYIVPFNVSFKISTQDI
jgi:hypothetical protein